MKTLIRNMAVWTVLLGASSSARAWDATASWNNPANGAPSVTPGGGGIYGTSGARDYNIACNHCHINDTNQQGAIDLKLTFNPPMTLLSGQYIYSPNQTYRVTAQMTGEHLGLTNCTSTATTGNANNMAAAIEDTSGKPAGVLASDSGQSASACPPTLPASLTGTTALYGDCHAVVSISGVTGTFDRTQWSFSWTAPAAGAGPLRLYFGAVDGNCGQSSLGDDVKMGNLTLVESTAALRRGLRVTRAVAGRVGRGHPRRHLGGAR
jgi:hypothetical protein